MGGNQKNIHESKNDRKKKSCKEEGKEKKFLHKEKFNIENIL